MNADDLRPVLHCDNRRSNTAAVAVSPEGWVGVSYYSLRNNPSRILVDEYLSVSKDGGQQFAKSLRVTATSWVDARSSSPTVLTFLSTRRRGTPPEPLCSWRA